MNSRFIRIIDEIKTRLQTLLQTRNKLTQKGYKIVAVVHAETSTGVMNPIKDISCLLDGSDSLFLFENHQFYRRT
ncbi:MAG: hypothetical protein ABIJ59_11435 [Pseudomonadota bacterium]